MNLSNNFQNTNLHSLLNVTVGYAMWSKAAFMGGVNVNF